MWNETIFINFIEDAFMKRRQTAFSREPVLILFDSCGTHVRFIELENEKHKYAKHNIHFMLVPQIRPDCCNLKMSHLIEVSNNVILQIMINILRMRFKMIVPICGQGLEILVFGFQVNSQMG